MVAQLNFSRTRAGKIEGMTWLRIAAFSAAAALMSAQGTRPKAQPSDYPTQATLENGFTLAAEYLVHSLPTPAGTLIAEDYLIVEVAFYGPPKSKLNLGAGNFVLRINTQKSTIQPDSAGTVAASIKYPDWTERRGVTPTASAGPVVYGPPVAPRFPGDPTGRPTISSPVPEQTDPNTPPKEAEMPIEFRVQASALEEGDRRTPASGLIFFPYRGRTKSIKSLELIYEGPAGKVSLKLL
jgi:hypothetical protein